jgi:CRISPR-associated protein Cas2
MHILVTYDVATETAGGRRRLRKVAQVCLNFGQRVQKSVFECLVNDIQREEVERRLIEIIDQKADSLRIYRLMEPKDKYLTVYGIDTAVNFQEPLVL